MNDTLHIRYVPRQEIDIVRWNHCIEEASNGLVYAYSSWLDNMARNWDALILGEYEALMPLTWNKKGGIRYLYQPPLTPQLGIFSARAISVDLVGAFLHEIIRHFRFAEIFLNYSNFHPDLRPHANYILELNDPHTDIKLNYKSDLRRNLKRVEKFNLHYKVGDELEKAISLHQKLYGQRTPHVIQADYDRFAKLCRLAQLEEELLLRSVSEDPDTLLCMALMLKKKNRIYFIMTTTLAAGRDKEATHFLLDNIIKEFAGTEFILDLVGSDIPGIAHFYQNFGSINQPYYFYQLNRLPWPMRIIKQFLDR